MDISTPALKDYGEAHCRLWAQQSVRLHAEMHD